MSGGTVDKVSIVGNTGSNFLNNLVQHHFEDLLPFIFCCKGPRKNYDIYYDRRPSDNGNAYVPEIPGKFQIKVEIYSFTTLIHVLRGIPFRLFVNFMIVPQKGCSVIYFNV